MYFRLLLPVAAVLVFPLAHGQDSNPTANSSSRGPVHVVKSGHDVTPPSLSDVDFSSLISAKCEQKLSGKVELSLIVDATGRARNIGFIKAQENYLDRLAVVVAQMNRFTPARRSGEPVAMGQSLHLDLSGCIARMENASGINSYRLLLSSAPKQELKNYDSFPKRVIFATEMVNPDVRSSSASHMVRIGDSVSAPIAINVPTAEYSPEAKAKGIHGVCLVRVIVDAYGLPEHPSVVRSLEPTLDQKAVEAVNRYRFKPALRDGMEPVPVLITIEVNFRLY